VKRMDWALVTLNLWMCKNFGCLTSGASVLLYGSCHSDCHSCVFSLSHCNNPVPQLKRGSDPCAYGLHLSCTVFAFDYLTLTGFLGSSRQLWAPFTLHYRAVCFGFFQDRIRLGRHGLIQRNSPPHRVPWRVLPHNMADSKYFSTTKKGT
jgi:hypothetical protein